MRRQDILLRDVGVDDAEALAHILVAVNDVAFRGRVPEQCLHFSETESAANWRRTLAAGLPREDVFVVAERCGERQLGYAWAGPHDDPVYRGELRQIAVLPSAQGIGIGRLLVGYVARRLAESNIRSLRVEVLMVNPYRRFYERLGGSFLFQHDFDWDGVPFKAAVYGWLDTASLVDHSPPGSNG